MARIARQLGLLVGVIAAAFAGTALLFGTLVALLQPVTGLAGALALVGVALLLVEVSCALGIPSLSQGARRRRRGVASVAALAEHALIPMPRRRLRRTDAQVALRAGLALLIVELLGSAAWTDRKDG